MNNLKNNFKHNFIQLLYYYEEWCKNGGYKGKATHCFNNGNNLKLYFIEKQDLNVISRFKKKIRKYYNKGNNILHIPDTQSECDALLRFIKLQYLIFYGQVTSMYINFPNFNKLY